MGRLRGPYTVWAFAGKDGLFGSEKLDEPDARALKDFWSSIGIGVKTVLDIDRHDSDGGLGLAAVDEWLQTVRGGKPK